MSTRLIEMFDDEDVVAKIKRRLPYLFQLAELESSRAGKIGMEVGSVRERIIVAMLIYKYGNGNVETEVPITEAEVDVLLFGEPVSIKTITGKSFGGRVSSITHIKDGLTYGRKIKWESVKKR